MPKSTAELRVVEPEPGEAEDLEEYGPSMITRGKLLGALGLMGVALYVVYSKLGALHVAGSGFIGAAIGFLIVAGILYLAALVVEHLLHIHHRSILAWLGRGTARCLSRLGFAAERFLNSAYIRLAGIASARFDALRDWWNNRRGDDGQADDTDEDDPADDDPAEDREDPPTDPVAEPAAAVPAEAPAAADPSRNGVPVTTSTDAPVASRAGGRFGGRRVPPEGRPMVAWVDDFTPATDEELHDVLLMMAAFQHDLGQAMHDLHQRCTSPALHLDRLAMVATTEAADGITDSAEACAAASARFARRYETVTEEVASGLELPKDGGFTTGNGAGS